MKRFFISTLIAICVLLVSGNIAAYAGETKIGALDWFDEVRYIFERGTEATITDIETGESFNIKRTYGYNHADIEPLTKDDAAIIKEIWGGSWSWERRAVVVIVGEYRIAGSMTAFPHAGIDSKPANITVSGRSGGYDRGVNLDTVKGNGVDGHMDIHFLNSRTHGTNTKQKVHQDMVKAAAEFILDNAAKAEEAMKEEAKEDVEKVAENRGFEKMES